MPVGGRRPRDETTIEIWGVLNVTPDSFSDGGRFFARDRAIARAQEMCAEGARVIDVGGASSRPPGATYGAGAAPVSIDEEIRRVVPVIDALACAGIRVSLDTPRGAVAEAGIAAGASIVNDVSMGADETLLEICARRGVELVLMHTRDGGRVEPASTAYADVAGEVIAELMAATDRAVDRGIVRDRIWIDPGIGFAKNAAQSAALLGATARLVATGQRVLIGASRKSFIAKLAPRMDGTEPGPEDRLGGSIAAVTAAVLGGAHAVRVHDVAASHQAARLAAAMRAGQSAPLEARQALGSSSQGRSHA